MPAPAERQLADRILALQAEAADAAQLLLELTADGAEELRRELVERRSRALALLQALRHELAGRDRR
jgi:hypothetical protein